MKGIILAGGVGSRLWPMTRVMSKQLLPVYDKPMIYYPMSVLMLAGINEIAIISTPGDLPRFRELFGNGSQLGLELSYFEQDKPRGIGEAFLICEDFIAGEPVALILGDNIFYSNGLRPMLIEARQKPLGARIFCYHVSNPTAYGVAELDTDSRVISIEEKPTRPKSKFAVTGLYFYDADVVAIAKSITPSARAELEITDINKAYLEAGKLEAEIMTRGFAWLDTGTPAALCQASQFIEIIEKRQGLKIACIEEIAYANNWIERDELKTLADAMRPSDYAGYLDSVAAGESGARG